MTSADSPADFAVSKSNPTDEELAAVATVLAAKARANATLYSADDRPLAGGWNSYYRTVRPQLFYGRDAWRTYIRLK